MGPAAVISKNSTSSGNSTIAGVLVWQPKQNGRCWDLPLVLPFIGSSGAVGREATEYAVET